MSGFYASVADQVGPLIQSAATIAPQQTPTAPTSTAPTATTPTPATAPVPAQAPTQAATVKSIDNPYSTTAQPKAVTPWNVTPEQTVAGQVNGLISQDGPLMQQAASRAAQQMNSRGLINSSMAVGAGQSAVMDKAMEIASRDAPTYGQAAQFNSAQSADIEKFNATESNKAAAQLAQNNAELQKLNLQITASQQNIPVTFAASISNTAMAGVNAIMADGNLTPAAKQAAIANVVGYANAQVSWAEAFYKTSIPKITAPAVK